MEDETLNGLNQSISSGLARIQRLKRNLVGFLGARERARKEYLPAMDYQFLIDYEFKLKQRDELERISKELIPPNGKYPEDFQAFQTIKHGIEKKISDLRSFLAQRNSQYWEILGKLEEPYRQKNVEMVIHRLLQNDLDVLRELKKASTDVLKKIDSLRKKIEVQEMPKSIFTAKEDGFKKLRSEQEKYEKALADYERETSEIRERELLFQNRKWTNNGEKLQAQYYLTKEKIHLKETGRRLFHTKIQLDNELTRLERLCQTKEAQEKIALIAAGILHKNLKIVHEYEEAKNRIGNLYEKLQEAKKRYYAFDEGYRGLKHNRVYRVIPSAKTDTLKENELVTIIADTLLGEPCAVQLVARSTDNNLEMEKDWELMSELDKDELINKKMVREL